MLTIKPLLLGCVLLVSSLTTQAVSRFEHLTINQGLSQSTIYAMIQDKQGFIWIGTQYGLNRYDGYEFINYYHDPTNSNSLSSNFILSLYEDKKGSIWIGTFNGLNKYDPKTNTFTLVTLKSQSNKKLTNTRITAISGDDKQLWIGTFKDGLWLYNFKDQQLTPFNTLPEMAERLLNNKITTIIKDNQQRIWISTWKNGLFQYNTQENSFVHYKHKNTDINTLSSNFINYLTTDNNGNLWIATKDRGVDKLIIKEKRFIHYTHNKNNAFSLSSNNVYSVFIDKKHQVWIGTKKGLNVLVPNTNNFSHYQHSNDSQSISGNTIQSIMQTRDGIMWIGTFSFGLNKYNPKLEKILHFNHDKNNPNSLSNNSVWAIKSDINNNIWVGTYDGLNRYNTDSEKFIHYRHHDKKNSISGNLIWSILSDHQGLLWFGTGNDKGLNKFDPNSQQFTHYYNDPKLKNSLSKGSILSVFEDSKKRLWLATYHGVNLFDPKLERFSYYQHDSKNIHSLSHNTVITIYEDSNNTIWVGTFGGGLNKFNEEQQNFTRYLHDPKDNDSISSNNVMAIIENSQKELWITTYGGGLNRLDRTSEKFHHINKKNGLASLSLYGILEDNQQNLWVSGNKGLSRINPKTFHVENYSENDGLQGDEFNLGAYYKSPTGELFFGGTNGFNRFFPEDMVHKWDNVPVVFTNMSLANTPVQVSNSPVDTSFSLLNTINYTPEITLSYLQSFFSFDFSALNFANSSRLTYSYKLEGWDKAWILTGALHRRATYTNIPAGNYRLRVRVQNSNGSWSKNQAQIKLTITPAPWRTWWAYMFYFITVFSIISYIIYQRREKFIAIKSREERLSLALWGSGNELWDWNVEEGSILRSSTVNAFYNQSSTEPFDYSHLKDRIHNDDLEKVMKTFKQQVNKCSDFIDVTYRMKDLQGRWRWVRNRARTVSKQENGQSARIVGTIQDVQELKQSQEDLRQFNKKLELLVTERTMALSKSIDELKSTQQKLVEAEKMASLGGLVRGVAHELNTPLGIAITSTSLIEDEIQQLCDKKNTQSLTKKAFDHFENIVQKSIELVTKNQLRCDQIIQDFKKIAMSESSLSSQKITLLPMLNHFIAQKQIQLSQQQVTINVYCDPELEIYSNPQAFEQIISQLIDNSLCHAFENSPIGTINIKAINKKNTLMMIFEDDGSGMTAEQLDNIFEPFYTTKRGTQCTGLGMHIVYNALVHQLSGEISCESALDQGVKISMSFPHGVSTTQPERKEY
ncbi:MAG: PAS domain-containing protein [Colwellia sp.]|nr:PAS domain-containing protein [Colwellia sp.]